MEISSDPTLPGTVDAARDLQQRIDEFITGRQPVRPQIIAAQPAAGRSVLLRRMGEYARNVAAGVRTLELSVPRSGLDAPANILLQIAALAPDSQAAELLAHAATAWENRVAAAKQILYSDPTIVISRLPSIPAADDRRQLAGELSGLTELLSEPNPSLLQILAVDDEAQCPLPARERDVHRLPLRSDAEAFLARPEWGELGPAASKLWSVGRAALASCSPLHLRLAVALIFDGANPSQILKEHLTPVRPLNSFAYPLSKMLRRRPFLGQALRRIACARLPIEEAVLRDLAAPDEADWPLIRSCFLYPAGGHTRFKFHDQLRWIVTSSMVSEDQSSSLATAHRKLRSYFESYDGATDPKVALRTATLPWIEKLHHASLADNTGDVTAWLALNPPCREHYWEYGWALSFLYKKYDAAARVFEHLLNEVDPTDNYGQHYCAFNLDRAGRRAADAEQYYERAVAGDPANPWWNSRYISFLTSRGKFDAALDAWHRAISVIDPDGSKSESGTLTFHLHLHVIDAAIESGQLELAEIALQAVPRTAIRDEKFQVRREQLDALVATRRLGEALFPAEIPTRDWWKPRMLARRLAGVATEDWRFGRILEVGATDLGIALGQLPSTEDDAIVEYHTWPVTRWQELAKQKPMAGDYFEYVQDQTGHEHLAVHPALTTEPDSRTAARIAHLLRYLANRA